MVKIMFLDFDGVVHPVSARGDYFRETNLEAISQAIANHEIEIVITSTWRLDKSLDELKSLLGFVLGKKVVGVTPEIDDPFLRYPRHYEVLDYLTTIGRQNCQWFAIDDTRAFYKPNDPVVLTNPALGFTFDDVAKVSEILG